MAETFEKYYTPEQLEYVQERGWALGEERIRQVEAEWPVLIEQVRAEMEKGVDPADERVRELAGRWKGLVLEFTGGDAGVGEALDTMNRQEADEEQREMYAYISRAMAASGDAE